MIRIATVGLGLFGRDRLKAIDLLRHRGRAVELVGIHDPLSPELEAIAAQWDARACRNLDEVVALAPDLVIVSIPHDSAVAVTIRLLQAGLRVLMEKPLGRSLAEAHRIAAAASSPGQLWVGFNYRFYQGIAALMADIAAGRFGRPVGLSLLLGHGGSPKDATSWKLDPVRAGGGCLIDPGVHLLDLCRVAAGSSLQVVGGTTWGDFWRTGIEEECRLLLVGERIPSIEVAVSVVRWRSTFRMEFFGDEGYGLVEGRGRSYGPQCYRRGRRWGWQGGTSQAESEEAVLTSDGDDSLAAELDALLFPGTGPRPASMADAVDTMALLDRCRAVLGLAAPELS